MTTRRGTPGADGPGFRTTLIRVLTVQVIALALLWLLQTLYHV
jgi:hypothetical protein